MTLKHVMVNLDHEIHQVAAYKLSKCGSSISEFCRSCLELLVTDGIELPNPTQIAAERVTGEIIKDLQSQQKIVSSSELATSEQQELARIRLERIETAARKILIRYPSFEKCLPENDHHGDFSLVLEDLINEITTESGYKPALFELKRIWQEVTA